MIRRPLLVLLCALPVLALGACGSPNQTAAGVPPTLSAPLPPTVSAPATVLPDGTVPWVEEPAGLHEFDTPLPQRRVDPTAKPCQADQLHGRLSSWLSPPDHDESGVPVAGPPVLIGYARVTNIGRQTCRLRGGVDTRLRDRNGELAISYTDNVDDTAKQRITIVPPGGSADLRLDWDGPFCIAVDGPLRLAITLPEGGGDLIAPVTADTTPLCTHNTETHPDLSSFLTSSAFDEPAVNTVLDSPLGHLTAAVEPVTTAAPGQLVTFHVRLTNPTGDAISLDPCPGYYQERFSIGTATVAAINDGGTYRLNCRAVHSIPAHGSVRYAMGVHIPTTLTAGRKLTVNWRLIAPRLAGEAKLSGGFSLTSTG